LTDGLTVVKGEKFDNWRTVGSAEATARLYASRDVDELVFLDVNARSRGSIIDKNLLNHFSNVLDIPFSVGGGIDTFEDAKNCFKFGAEKVVLGTSAIVNPRLITEIADVFGNQAVIVAIDFESDTSDKIRIESGSIESNVDIIDFIENLSVLGAGEILLTSMDRDGTRDGFDIALTHAVSSSVGVPVIASGGVGTLDHLAEGVLQGGATGVLAASIFHFGEHTIAEAKSVMSSRGVRVRPVAS
jgi:cyclase